MLSPENNTFNPYYLYLRDDMVTPAADAETARRFFSWLYFPYLLPNKVVTPNFPQPDTKFFTGVPRLARFDNSALAKVAKDQNFWNYENDPIKTEFQKGEPRLLIVAVDIQDATSSVTFDSYLCESKYKDGTHSFPEHIIKYTDGISMKHVRASMSPHTVIDYPWLLDEQDDSNKDKKRYFWDGAYLSNTPLREVLHLHRYYWYTLQNARLNNTDELKNKSSKAVDGAGSIDSDSNELHVPHLEIYIANLYPIVEQDQDIPPKDPDIIQDRELDIRFHDKTRYDIKISELITDYLILHGQMKNLALKHIGIFDKNKIQGFEEEYQSILGGLTHSQKRSSNEYRVTDNKYEAAPDELQNDRTYKDLIDGRFDVARVVYINRKDDQGTIFGKAADFSKETMILMKEKGYEDAWRALDIASEKKSSQSYKII